MTEWPAARRHDPMWGAAMRTRRAPNACAWCRHRKVRCDASILGCPCTRCRQDGRNDCALQPKLPRQPKMSSGRSRMADPFDAERQSNPHVDNQDEYVWAPKRLFHPPHNEYPFIDSEYLSALPPEDVAFLSAKGSRSLPDENATYEFACHYFKRIHPSVPMVDEAEFWSIYQDGSGPGKLSMFVFQAILFASCPFVSMETLHRCGFNDKRDARKQLYNRAKLLFDLNAEPRPSARAQGAVLLTHHTSAEDPQAGSFWLTRAIENAMMIDAQPSLHVENVKESIKKRLWWSILLRDRSLCIGLRRRPQLPTISHSEYCDWLTEDDFADEMQHSRVYDYAAKQSLLHALQDQCQLAVALSDLVSLVFAPRVIPSCFLSAEQFDALMSTIERIRLSLVEWERKSLSLTKPAATTDPAAILSNLSCMYFHAARVDLAQYAAFTIEENLSLVKDTYNQRMLEIGRDLKRGIEGLTSAMEYFSNKGHLESLPLSVLGYVGMPLILTAIDMKLSPSYEEMTRRKKRLDSLSTIIRHSETLYDVTDYVAIGINHILQLAYLTTKNLFLRCKRPSERELIRQSPETSPTSERSVLRTESQTQQSKFFGRATNWVDAFTLWPRAYLLISTSVDYSLQVGRLPYDNALPELVRHIPAMGAVQRLPWSIDVNASILGGMKRRGSCSRQPRIRLGSSGSWTAVTPTATTTTTTTTTTPQDDEADERAQHRQPGTPLATDCRGAMMEDKDADIAMLDFPAPEGNQTETQTQTQNQLTSSQPANPEKETTINLDYLDLNNAHPTFSENQNPSDQPPLETHEIRSPKGKSAVRTDPAGPGPGPGSGDAEEDSSGMPFDPVLLDTLSRELMGDEWEGL